MSNYTQVFATNLDSLTSPEPSDHDTIPRFLSFDIIIKQISCGDEHLGFISSRGYVYTLGSNKEGRLGIGS